MPRCEDFVWEMRKRTRRCVVQHYESLIRFTRRLALLNSMIIALNRFVGYCVLTWASVVVLGGLVSNLDERQLVIASLVLLLQAIQFACAASWITVLAPPRLSEWFFHGRWKENVFAFWPVTAFGMLGHSCIFLSLAVSIKELTAIHTQKAGDVCVPVKRLVSMSQVLHSISTIQALQVKAPAFRRSFRAYYILVLSNAIVALLGVWMYLFRLSIGLVSTWLYSYGYRVLQVALDKGEVAAGNIELVDAVFEILGDECSHGLQAEANNILPAGRRTQPPRGSTSHTAGSSHDEQRQAQPETFNYFLCEEVVMYVHGHERGFEAAMEALSSPNRYVQEAVALMIGFWVDLETKDATFPRLLPAQVSLLTRIMELAMNGPLKGPRARAIMGSLEKVANHDRTALLADPKFIRKLLYNVAILVGLILNDPRVAEYQDSLYLYLRLLTTLLHHSGSDYSCFENRQMYLVHEELSKVLSGGLIRSKATQETAISFLQNPYFQQKYTHTQIDKSLSGFKASSKNHVSSHSDDSNVPQGIRSNDMLRAIIPPFLFYLLSFGLDVALYYALCGGDSLGHNPFEPGARNGY